MGVEKKLLYIFCTYFLDLLYLKGKGERNFALANIFRLAAYKQAWSHCGSVTLEGKQHLVVSLHSRAASLRALRLKCEPVFAPELSTNKVQICT